MLTYREFRELVQEMREAQRGFYSAPRMTNERSSFLAKSKRLEAKVDRALMAGPKQQSLFDADNSEGGE